MAALGTFLLGRALGMGGAGAFLAGLAFGFGLWFVTWLSWPLDSVWAWLPWLLWLADRVVRRPSRAAVAALALVVALQFFGGHPESSFHVLAAAALFSLLPLSRAGRAAWPRAIGRLALGLGAGIALAAVALLPFADLLRHSADLASRGERQPVKVAFRYVLGLALPEYWGRPTAVISQPFINARAWYVGALPLLLAGVALLRGGRERVAVAGASLVVAAGGDRRAAVLRDRAPPAGLQPVAQHAARGGRRARRLRCWPAGGWTTWCAGARRSRAVPGCSPPRSWP